MPIELRLKHTWDICPMCGPMVRCGTCGNNCCNGGRGELPDGSPCPDCHEAYEIQDAAYKDGTAPKDEDIHTTRGHTWLAEVQWADPKDIPVDVPQDPFDERMSAMGLERIDY